VHLGRYINGIPLVGEALYRRYITPEGTLQGGPEEEDYGFDLAGLVGKPSTVIPSLAARIEAEALKDERIRAASATVTPTTTPNGATALLILLDVDSSEGPFQLQMLASAFEVELVGIT
jgi:hypothetical protein